MIEPFIFINTFAIKEGRTEDFLNACQKILELAETSEPRLLHIGFYVNEEGTEATTVQVHPDEDSMSVHMKVAEEHINEAHDFLDFTTMRYQVYGSLSEAVLEQMRQLAGSGVSVTNKDQASGFNRLPAL
ncbi:MAG: hypothetical protein ACRDWI_08855 [Jiangellaceae bacterium]